ncbi:MAG: response regulator transcription factor [Elusimicrobia bacterium]|nr:response regulator transcription factor [Elusimicrobiota bacterium]
MEDKLKILIIDDETDYLNIAAQILKNAGFEVMTAENGKDGLDIIIGENPDLLILDIGLPDISGIDLKKQLNKNLSAAKIPVIFFTVCSEMECLRNALNQNNCKYLIKPFNPDDLLEKVKSFLGPAMGPGSFDVT